MPAYLVAYEEGMRDPESLREYGQKAYPTLVAHGARFLAAGSQYVVLEGDWRPELVGIVEFPTLADAQGWYRSPEYSAVKHLRQQASRSNMLLIDGR